MSNRTHSDYKVLPFETSQGHVPGHEIRRFHYDWMDGRKDAMFPNPVKYVVFDTFDQVAQMPVEHVVHWTRWTEYARKHWPSGGSISAVLLEDGRRVRTTSLSIMYDDGGYLAAPITCRDSFKIVTLGGRDPLLEIVGVEDYAMRRIPMVDPWERDNAEFSARMKATA